MAYWYDGMNAESEAVEELLTCIPWGQVARESSDKLFS